MTRPMSTLPQVVQASEVEVSTGKLTSRNLEKAVKSLHQDGLVVISDVVPHKELDHLNAKMIEDARYLQSLGDKGPYNYNKGNIQQDPPPLPKYFSKDIFLNLIASQVTSTMLGPRPKWTFCSGNTAVRGPEPQRQPVHSDADFSHPDIPFALVVNIPMIDFTPENGSTEIWLGTHDKDHAGLHVQEGLHGERASGRIKQELLEKRRLERGPEQPRIKKGSIVIRDLRLWHAGMPNMTDDVRVMLAMSKFAFFKCIIRIFWKSDRLPTVHFAPWYRNPMKLEFSEGLKEVIEGQQELEIPTQWVSEEEAAERYLNRGFGNSYDFNQTP